MNGFLPVITLVVIFLTTVAGSIAVRQSDARGKGLVPSLLIALFGFVAAAAAIGFRHFL